MRKEKQKTGLIENHTFSGPTSSLESPQRGDTSPWKTLRVWDGGGASEAFLGGNDLQIGLFLHSFIHLYCRIPY